MLSLSLSGAVQRARPSRVHCTAHHCLNPVAENGFFCAMDWAAVGPLARYLIERADRRGDGATVRDHVRAARRWLAGGAA